MGGVEAAGEEGGRIIVRKYIYSFFLLFVAAIYAYWAYSYVLPIGIIAAKGVDTEGKFVKFYEINSYRQLAGYDFAGVWTSLLAPRNQRYQVVTYQLDGRLNTCRSLIASGSPKLRFGDAVAVRYYPGNYFKDKCLVFDSELANWGYGVVVNVVLTLGPAVAAWVSYFMAKRMYKLKKRRPKNI